MRRTRVVILAKAPVPGRAKTRLIPALGEVGAARLAHRMLLATAEEAVAAELETPELCADPHPLDASWSGLLPPQALEMTAQGDGDLGERLARATKRVIDLGEQVLLIGTDCPQLNARRLRAAGWELEMHDAVIYPTFDGGYALLGLRRFDPSLFSDIAWSTSTVANTTIGRVKALGWSLHLGETLRDIDEPEDLAAAEAAGFQLSRL
nr:TIGR04282 family arsenosugar biosynthesis glycosyltransferase [uncultured Sphingosinicella sp.]